MFIVVLDTYLVQSPYLIPFSPHINAKKHPSSQPKWPDWRKHYTLLQHLIHMSQFHPYGDMGNDKVETLTGLASLCNSIEWTMSRDGGKPFGSLNTSQGLC